MSDMKRREFFGKSAFAGAGAVSAAVFLPGKVSAANRPAFKRRGPSSVVLLKVEYLACDPSGHLAIWVR